MHCLTYAGPLQFHGEHRSLAACIIQPGLRANFSRESLQLSQWGKRWVVQHPQLMLWDRVRGMQHSLKACSHLGEGGLCGQGVRWNVPTSIPRPSRRQWPRECPLRKFLKGSLQLSQWGKRWVVQHPQLTLWDRVRGMQHSLKACSHLGKPQ